MHKNKPELILEFLEQFSGNAELESDHLSEEQKANIFKT
jgi:hypothetical protein